MTNGCSGSAPPPGPRDPVSWSIGLAVVLVASTCHVPLVEPRIRAEARPEPPPAVFDPTAEAGPAAIRRAFIEARDARAQGDVERAESALETVAASDSPLAIWASLDLAQSVAERDPARAVELTRPIADRAWPGARRARLVLATSLARTGDDADAVPLLRELVRETPDNVGAASAGMPLAAILERSDDPLLREEALGIYRRVMTRAPAADVGAVAETRANAVFETLPDPDRERLASVPVDDLFARASAYYASMRHEEAELAFHQIAARPDVEAGRRCEARLLEGKAILRRRDRDRGAQLLRGVASECADPSLRASALYYAAKALALAGRHADAIPLFDAVTENAPGDALADDAVLFAAISAGATGDRASMLARLRTIPDRFPDGDMRGEARFRLAWEARRDAAGASPADREALLDEALHELDTSIAEGPNETGEDIRGRARYWRARTLLDLGRDDDAASAFAELARAHPLSYYAQQALARLDEIAPDVGRDVREGQAPRDDGERLVFPLRPELQSDAMARAIELAGVAEIDRAMLELEAAGALANDADRDLVFAAAAVLDHAGFHPEASRIVRRRIPDVLDSPPVGRAYHLWRIAYPRAFAPLVEHTAEGEHVPPAFLRAIAREESAFDPRALSPAHAYGLTQLIRPTARRFGAEIGLTPGADDLLDPETNLRIGAHFMAFLFARYPDRPGVVPSAYNAGEGATDRWLRERPTVPLDEWIEEIPYDETRRYTRRVLQSWGIYSWLDDGRLPAFRS